MTDDIRKTQYEDYSSAISKILLNAECRNIKQGEPPPIEGVADLIEKLRTRRRAETVYEVWWVKAENYIHQTKGGYSNATRDERQVSWRIQGWISRKEPEDEYKNGREKLENLLVMFRHNIGLEIGNVQIEDISGSIRRGRVGQSYTPMIVNLTFTIRDLVRYPNGRVNITKGL